MPDTKPWYLSRTIWAAIVSVIATAAAALGVPIDAVARQGLAEAALQLVSAGAGIIAIIGRVTASRRIG
ncbi:MULTISPECIES: hypothetical protein [unclassified Roseitalea]|uniref:hypothetical protein n=1 Tax=unclassified Roseitalea TaxID=2639107 RepID=UPI00273D9BAE|nr:MULTISPECIES: hypothetical protein [unclassified Roseitalea]